MSTSYVNVTRDGERLAGPLTENAAFSWLLRYQTKSVDLAIAEEGYAFEPAEWEPLKAEDVLMGTTEEGTRVYLDMSLQRQSAEGKISVTHEKVTEEFLRFSASGHTVLKGKRADNWDGAGQMLDSLLEVTTPAKGWTLAELKEVHRLWKNWHLNDMKAACAHMPTDAHQRWDNKEQVLCEEGSGYSYGSAWLVRLIPSTVVVRMQELIRKAMGATK